MNFSFKEKNSLRKKIVFGLLLFFLFFNFVAAEPAKAQFITSNLTLDADTLKRQVKDYIQAAWDNIGQAAGRALMKTMRNFLNKFAQDSATWLASGNYNKGPMWITNAATYWKNAGDAAGGDFIGNFGDEWSLTKKYGINLCAPGPPELNLQIRLSMVDVQNPQPRCKLSEVTKAYEQMAKPEYWDKIAVGFEPGQNGLSISRTALEGVQIAAADGKEQALLAAQLEGKATPKKEPVSQDATAGTVLTEEELKTLTAAYEKAKKEKEAEDLKNDITKGGNIVNLLKEAGNVFLDTLSNKVQQTLLKKGLLSLSSVFNYLKGLGGGSDPTAYEAQLAGTRQAAEAYFAFFTKPSFTEIEDYRAQYLAEIATDCSVNPSPFCNTVDDSFKEIFNLAQTGTPVTVAEALNKQLLHSDWPILGPGVPCKIQAYCYDNLVKLRVLRILPIGWELAAKVSAIQGQPVSLGQAVAQFYTPTDPNANPFYHLIDPNWLIVAPKARCAAQAYGSLMFAAPTDNTPGQRSQYCADIQNCVGEDSKTGICNSWGYCLREKNFWRLGGDSCDAQFNSCTIYTNNQGQQVSYLANTLDKGICNADNVGCRGYATAGTPSITGLQWNLAGRKIYFNNSAEQCDSSSEGCTKFIRTAPEVFNQPLNLKKAPTYDNCYGESLITTGTPTPTSLSSSTLAWAANKADLYKIFSSQTLAQKQACANFAQVCSAEEKGCELYTPNNGNPAIPGILTVNDQCPNECIGYENYVEQPITQFSSASTNYFIPSSAKSCQSDYVGCEEFVNLEAQTAGGEQKEYYSKLKTCSKNETEGQTYYTWEGSDTTGYQLKTYNLKTTIAGSGPDYNTANINLIDTYNTQCSATVFANRISLGAAFDPDCREFYDRSGAKFYRLYSKTITVSPTECKTLRKTASDETSCNATGGTWDATQKFCTYLTITSEAKSCPAEAVGCRAYRGNAGNNFQTIYSQNFESGTVGQDAVASTGWAGKFSTESTVVGGKSLKVTGSTAQTISSEGNKTYIIYFWAKGEAGDLTVDFYPSDPQGNLRSTAGTAVSSVVSLNNNWTSYTVGPFTVDWLGTDASTTIKFSVAGGKTFYLDNLVAKVMTDNIYVVKNSWVTPSSCDNVVGDPVGESAGGTISNPVRLVPQAQLGCTSYKNRQGQGVAAKSFTNICREEAVGCEELVDTYNTATASSTIVNAFCALWDPVNHTTSTSQSNQPLPCKDKNGEVKCDILPNQTGCHFNLVGQNSGFITSYFAGKNWEVYSALSDGSATDEKNNNYTVKILKDEQTIIIPQDKTVYLVNDQRFQCADDKLGCRALGSITYDKTGVATSTATVYLKDQPDNYDKILCENSAEGCDKYTTSNGGNDYFKDPLVFGNKLCEWKDSIDPEHPYGGWVIKGTTSTCYAGLNYHILKNKDNGYNGAIGICPAEQDSCSEFVDPSGGGTSSNPAGQAYYLLNNEKLDRAACQGQASLQQGCVLFNETSKGDLLWNSKQTYADSQAQNYNKVNPKDCGTNGEKCGGASNKNDANVVLKVTRDRVCGEWLACASTMKVIKDGKPTEVCTELRNCDEASASNSNSDELLGKCAHWVDNGAIYPGVNNYLTLDDVNNVSNSYRNYPKVGTFEARDFSGYSIPGGYQIAGLTVANNGLRSSNLAGSNENIGVFADQKKITVGQSCRGFATGDVAKGSEDLCSTTKVTYSGSDKTPIDKFYPANQLLDNSGICDGGFDENGNSKKGISCFNDNDCSDDRPNTGGQSTGGVILQASCLTNKKVTRQFGWQGYCLFRDSNTQACLQWFPLSIPSNTTNLYELNQTAGYYPPEGSGKFWCVEAKGNANRKNVENVTLGSGINAQTVRVDYNSISYGFVGRREIQDSKVDVSVSGSNNMQLFPNTGSWNELTTSANDLEKTVNINEVAAIGIKVQQAEGNDWPLAGSELLIFPNQILNGVQNGGVSQDNPNSPGNGFYWSGPLKISSGGNPYLDLTWVEVNKISKGYFNSSDFDFPTKGLCDRFEAANNGDRPNFLSIRFFFNEQSGNLDSIYSKICDASAKYGWVRVDVVYYLKEMCNEVRQVVDTESPQAQNAPFGILSKARTDRVWSGSVYKLGGDVRNISPMDLTYDQFNTPFGSLSRNLQPSINTLDVVLQNKKTATEKKIALKQYGPWTLWFGSGGGTPLGCAGFDNSDCGNTALCQSGPKKGMLCDPNSSLELNGCAEDVSSGICENIKTCYNAKTVAHKDIPNDTLKCAADSDCQGQDIGPCVEKGFCPDDSTIECVVSVDTCPSGKPCTPFTSTQKQCQKTIDNVSFNNISCSSNDDCLLATGTCSASLKNTCTGGVNNGQLCSKVGDVCAGSTITHPCVSANNIRGLCVGGSNHGHPCAGASDCPSKTYTATDSNKEVVENGICVGSSLDDGKTIPVGGNSFGEYPNPDAYPSRTYCRLREIFAQVFNTWGWDAINNKYTVRSGVATEDMSVGSAARSQPKGTQFGGYDMGCEKYANLPLSGINSDAVYTPHPPKVYSLAINSNAPTGYTWGKADNFSVNLQTGGVVKLTGNNAVANVAFFAFADNDQMPIQRVAIDWGDGSPVYTTKGWFKNQKPWCNKNTVCNDGTAYNLSCDNNDDCGVNNPICTPAKDDSKTTNIVEHSGLYFGNSTGACEENYFTFKHAYECKVNGPGWDAASGACKFIPKVQILDNWGWCNGACTVAGVTGGCWSNDCDTGASLPWTNFGGSIEINP